MIIGCGKIFDIMNMLIFNYRLGETGGFQLYGKKNSRGY